MSEMILPGIYIEVRSEGLIRPGPVSVGNLGVVGTASKGPVDQAVILGSFTEALDMFGAFGPWDPTDPNALSLVRALEQAYMQGANTVFAVRVASAAAAAAGYTLQSPGGNNVVLSARTPGTWGHALQVNVTAAATSPFVEQEVHPGGAAITLNHPVVVNSPRNRIQVFAVGTGITRSLPIVYDATPAGVGQVNIDTATGALTFGDGNPVAGDVVTASYVVAAANAVRVTLRLGESEEVYTVVSGDDLVADITRLSAWVNATADINSGELPTTNASPAEFAGFSGGNNGEVGADYQDGLDVLLNEDAHIIVAAGQDQSFGDNLAAHCRVASSDDYRRERIVVVGSGLGNSIDTLRGHSLNSDRLIFVAPGIVTNDGGAATATDVVLPGAYAAAGVAGLISSLSAHISATNKPFDVGGLETTYTSAQLAQLVQSRVFVLEKRLGFKIVKGITTTTNSAFSQVTTRRIVDFAKFGVRSASDPFIGKLNNERVRAALKGSINSFLADMVDREMLTGYTLDVSATRDQEIRGIAQVTMSLQPTFSIDFIRVIMNLQ